MIPCVTATTACSGFLPVAKAFGASSGMIYTLGMGMPAFWTRIRTMACSSGASASVTGWARYILSTSLSLNQYIPTFMTVAITMAMTMPLLPPSAPPMATNSTTINVIKPTVFTVFICFSVLR